MNLIIILLTTVGVLTFLSGLIVLFGSTKGDRIRSIWFFLAAFFSALWMGSISIFLQLKPGTELPIYELNSAIFILAMLLDVAFLGYTIWSKKHGKPVTLLFFAISLILSAIIAVDPSSVYSDIILSNTGNSFTLNITPVFICYSLFFGIVVPLCMYSLFREVMRSRSKRKRTSSLIVLCAYGIGSLFVIVSEMILPFMGNSSVLWLGPLAIGAFIIVDYYVILRYQSLNLHYAWIRIFSYIVMVASIAIIYMIIFSIIFAALFMGSTPSTEVILLNFIMILIFIALMPAMTGLTKLINSIIAEQHPQHAERANRRLAKKSSSAKASSSASTKSTKKEPPRA